MIQWDRTTTQLGASSSTSSTHSWIYDTFICFRGADTRSSFPGHLYNNLIQKGIKTFLADEFMSIGEEQKLSVFQAIGESKISIIVFSQNFGSSEWCLDQLGEIMRCKESIEESNCLANFLQGGSEVCKKPARSF